MLPFDPATHRATFLVLAPDAPVTTAQATATFGRPASVYDYRPYTIMVWHKNLLSDLAPVASLLVTKTWPFACYTRRLSPGYVVHANGAIGTAGACR